MPTHLYFTAHVHSWPTVSQQLGRFVKCITEASSQQIPLQEQFEGTFI